jgi:hypothetical protein
LQHIGFTSNIDDIFSPDLLDQIEKLQRPINNKLHKRITEFIDEVKKLRGKKEINYLALAGKYIDAIGHALRIDNNFIDYCKSLQSFEPMLFQFLPNYRAHFIHQLNVFLNGYLIVNHNFFGRRRFNKIKDIFAERLDIAKNKKKSIDILKAWFTTAMFHDTGYPLGKVGNWTENFIGSIFGKEFEDIARRVVETISFRLFRETFRTSLDSLISHLFTWLRLSDTQKNKISQKIHDLFFDKLSENLIAALILLKAAENTKMDDPVTLSSAVVAIILDDEEMWNILMDKTIDKSVSYTDHPLAFLLVYSDNIQEYGRYKTDHNRKKEKTGEAVIFDACKVVKQTIAFEDKKIHCILEYQDKPAYWDGIAPLLEKLRKCWKAPPDLDFVISYNNHKDGTNFDRLHFLTGN